MGVRLRGRWPSQPITTSASATQNARQLRKAPTVPASCVLRYDRSPPPRNARVLQQMPPRIKRVQPPIQTVAPARSIQNLIWARRFLEYDLKCLQRWGHALLCHSLCHHQKQGALRVGDNFSLSTFGAKIQNSQPDQGVISLVPTGRLASESSVSRVGGAEDSPASLWQ